jgi:myo-inositol-1(or 4)-monophosphatase
MAMTTPRDPDLDAVLSHLRELIVRAGELSLREYEVLDQERIEFKQEKDLVTRADRNVEAFLVQELNRAYPDHDVFGEESGRTLRGSPYCWVIDPIDGTTSFVHGQPFYSVSVALQYRGRTVVGAVYAPRLGELFWAVTGRGAFLNERRLHVSSRDRLVESVVATGFACLRADLETNNLPFFNRIAPRVRA